MRGVELAGLSRRFGEIHAVDDIHLTVEPGEIYGFLGLNGAGKTTTIRMMLGLIRPSSGVVRVLGEEVRPGGRGPWGRVGHLVEAPAAYPELTVRENLEVAGKLQGLSERAAVSRAIERFGLVPYADRRARGLSTGNLQRLGLARALLHRPELVVLDEPTNGLDPAGVVEIRELLRGLSRDHGTTIFMSSHILGEVDRIATRIGIIHEGRLLEELETGDLQRGRRRHLEVTARDRPTARAVLASAGYPLLEEDDGVLRIHEQRAVEAPDQVADLLAAAGAPPTHLVVQQEGLEAHFLRRIGRLP